MPDIKQMREERRVLITQARDLVDQADGESRKLNDEEKKQYDKMLEDSLEMKDRIDDEERLLDQERDAAAAVAPGSPGEGRGKSPTGIETTETEEPAKAMDGFRAFLQYGDKASVAAPGMSEWRALQADSDTGGGYMVPPEEFIAQLIKFVDDQVFIRGRATIQPIANAASIGAPSLDTDPEDATWTQEITSVDEDTAMAFGKRNLEAHPAAKLIKVSRKLLRISAIPVETLVAQRLAYKFGVTQEKAYLTGDGAGQPLGVFTASGQGISTSRDVSTGMTATEIRFDGLKEVKYSLKSQYWPNAAWMFHRDGVKQVSKLKDGEGRYQWEDSLKAGEPDMLMGFPVDMSEFAPNTFTASQYVGMLADWSQYWILDSLDFRLQRLDELYAETDQVGFIGRYEGDGMPVLEEAFSRVKLAAS